MNCPFGAIGLFSEGLLLLALGKVNIFKYHGKWRLFGYAFNRSCLGNVTWQFFLGMVTFSKVVSSVSSHPKKYTNITNASRFCASVLQCFLGKKTQKIRKKKTPPAWSKPVGDMNHEILVILFFCWQGSLDPGLLQSLCKWVELHPPEWGFPKMVGFPPKSSVLMGFSGFPLFSPSILGFSHHFRKPPYKLHEQGKPLGPPYLFSPQGLGFLNQTRLIETTGLWWVLWLVPTYPVFIGFILRETIGCHKLLIRPAISVWSALGGSRLTSHDGFPLHPFLLADFFCQDDICRILSGEFFRTGNEIQQKHCPTSWKSKGTPPMPPLPQETRPYSRDY